MEDENVKVQEARVTYSTKELLRDIHTRLDRIDNAVGNIPTRSEMDHLEKRIDGMERWRLQQEAVKLDRSTQFGVRERVVGVAIAVTLLVLQILTTTHVL